MTKVEEDACGKSCDNSATVIQVDDVKEKSTTEYENNRFIMASTEETDQPSSDAHTEQDDDKHDSIKDGDDMKNWLEGSKEANLMRIRQCQEEESRRNEEETRRKEGDILCINVAEIERLTGKDIDSSLAQTLNQAVLKIMREVNGKLTYWGECSLSLNQTDEKPFKRFGWKSMNSEQAKRLDEQSTFDRYFLHHDLMNAHPIPPNLMGHVKLYD